MGIGKMSCEHVSDWSVMSVMSVTNYEAMYSLAGVSCIAMYRVSSVLLWGYLSCVSYVSDWSVMSAMSVVNNLS